MRRALGLLELVSALGLGVVGLGVVLATLVGTAYAMMEASPAAGCCTIWFLVPGLALLVQAVGGLVRPLDPEEHQR